MTADSSWAVQAAVYGQLSINGSLTSLLANGSASVFDHVLPDAAFPYVVIGETSAKPLNTQQTQGYDITLAIHSYSRAAGMKELRGIMAAVRAILDDAALPLSGHALVLCDAVSDEARLEADGLTRHGVQRFRIVTEPA
ncbi:MAG: DUF3168 domain-containing protein [Alphaproteobacteria bacterium]|nr:DUF3168 domain-containing protein [Alphaproteobacteria bacterium]